MPLSAAELEAAYEVFPELAANNSDWDDGYSRGPTPEYETEEELIARELARFSSNDYGIPYVPPEHEEDEYWGSGSDDEEMSTLDDEVVPPPAYGSDDDASELEDNGVPDEGDESEHEDESLEPLDEEQVTWMATRLGISDVAAFDRLARDPEVRHNVAWLLQTSFFEFDLLDFGGWHLARRIFLVGFDNADEILDRSYPCNDLYSHDKTGAGIATAFLNIEARRRNLGIEPWGSMSENWRVCYRIFQLYLTDGPPMLADLCHHGTMAPGYNGETMEKLSRILPAVQVYAESMCALEEYDPILKKDW